MNNVENNDQYFIKRTFELALFGQGKVSPNPLVGCVIVNNGQIVSEGFHHYYGAVHAEVDAISKLPHDYDFSNCTLYCNLEPCCHTNKQTPPCTPLIIDKKFKRIVVSNIDPNPLVCGKGLELLKSSGVETTSGILKDEGAFLNRVFFHNVRTQLPYIHLKVAQTLDGKMATASGSSKWISDENARCEVHQLRKLYDGILIGRNTLDADDPLLTVRIEGETIKWPKVIIVGNPNLINFDLKIFDHKADRIILAFNSEIKLEDKILHKISSLGVILVPIKKEKFINDLLEKIYNKKICSILVEGGAKIVNSFLHDGNYNQMTVYVSPKLAGNGPSLFFSEDIIDMSQARCHKNVKTRLLGDQAVFEIFQ